ncbi:hypothetical protein D3C86_2135290 [compost metagenome]
MVAIHSNAWPVRKMYLNGVMRAMMIFTAKITIRVSATSEPNSRLARPAMAATSVI